MGSLYIHNERKEVKKDVANAPVEHGVESRNFVHPHSWHLQQFRNIVHDTNASPSLVLSLAKVEERDGGGFLVLRRIPSNDFLCPLHVFRVEFEGDLHYPSAASRCQRY